MTGMRLTLAVMVMTVLGACAPGVEFDEYPQVAGAGYQSDRAARDAALSGNAARPNDSGASEPLSALGPDAEASRIGADTQAALAATRSGEDGAQAGASSPASAVTNSAGLSRENDFEAVDQKRSIEQDAQRIARNREQYTVVQPEDIGSRPGDVGPNIVAYALATTHPKGTQIYQRTGFNLENRAARNCAQYASPDKAQIAFLQQGGPERDRAGLDPDGDGYACAWDPGPYRRAVAE